MKIEKKNGAKLICPDCGATMVLRESVFYGLFFGCSNYPKCTMIHSAHKDGTPMGIPANKETRQARVEAHNAFDKLWMGTRDCGLSRSKAYRWLSKCLGLTEEECHIGRFDIATCDEVIHLCTGVNPIDVSVWAKKNNCK